MAAGGTGTHFAVMPKPFIFRCPVTRLNVQALIETDVGTANDYVPQHCDACGRLHLLSRMTGKLLADEADIVDER